MSKKIKWDFRDVSLGFQIIRDFLLGRKHTLHGRFAPKLAPRSIPRPDLPRGPEDKYSNNYYYTRSAFETVRPPVVAPVAEGPPVNKNRSKPPPVGEGSGVRPDEVMFTCYPLPGPPWWWDGHCYFEYVPDPEPPYVPPCPPPRAPPVKCQAPLSAAPPQSCPPSDSCCPPSTPFCPPADPCGPKK